MAILKVWVASDTPNSAIWNYQPEYAGADYAGPIYGWIQSIDGIDALTWFSETPPVNRAGRAGQYADSADRPDLLIYGVGSAGEYAASEPAELTQILQENADLPLWQMVWRN